MRVLQALADSDMGPMYSVACKYVHVQPVVWNQRRLHEGTSNFLIAAWPSSIGEGVALRKLAVSPRLKSSGEQIEVYRVYAILKVALVTPRLRTDLKQTWLSLQSL